jgi:hypothetical protein
MSSYELLGVVATQADVFPFVEFILPTDYNNAKTALQTIIEADYPGGVVNLNAWRYVGLGGQQIKTFLTRYVLYAREKKDFITPVTFSVFQNEMHLKWPDLATDQLTVWLNAMISATAQATLPDTILKPYNYVPEEITAPSLLGAGIKPLVPQVNLAIWVLGGVAVIYLLGKTVLTKGIKLPSKSV